MAKVWCAAVYCKHNRNNVCIQKEIKLSAGRVHTIQQGLMPAWQCKGYELSEDAKKIMEELKKTISKKRKDGGVIT